jgi:hypothetical protein
VSAEDVGAVEAHELEFLQGQQEHQRQALARLQAELSQASDLAPMELLTVRNSIGQVERDLARLRARITEITRRIEDTARRAREERIIERGPKRIPHEVDLIAEARKFLLLVQRRAGLDSRGKILLRDLGDWLAHRKDPT